MDAVKILSAVILSLPVIAIRTVCRFVGSLIFNIVNIFVGIKNLFVLTMQEGKWWRWLLLIVKLPVVLITQVAKLVLTATLGTLFYFFESIMMTFKLANSIFDDWGKPKKDISIEYYDLYNRNLLEYGRQTNTESSYFKVVIRFMFGLIDIDMHSDGILSTYKFFLSIIGKFLGLGQKAEGINNFRKKVFDRYDNIEDQLFLMPHLEYQSKNEPAIIAAGIIAPYEVL